jgi:hypothetical protein
MSARDWEQLCIWIRGGATLGEVCRTQRVGLLGNVRFDERARDWYVLLWTWGAPRFGGQAGLLQDRYYDRLGKEALERRIARARAFTARILAKASEVAS